MSTKYFTPLPDVTGNNDSDKNNQVDNHSENKAFDTVATVDTSTMKSESGEETMNLTIIWLNKCHTVVPIQKSATVMDVKVKVFPTRHIDISHPLLFRGRVLDDTASIELCNLQDGFSLHVGLLPHVENVLRCVHSQSKHLLAKGIVHLDGPSLFGDEFNTMIDTVWRRASSKIGESINTEHKYGTTDSVDAKELSFLLSKLKLFAQDMFFHSRSSEYSLFADFTVHYSTSKDKVLVARSKQLLHS